MKKIIVMTLVLILVFGLAACGEVGSSGTETPAASTDLSDPAPNSAENPSKVVGGDSSAGSDSEDRLTAYKPSFEEIIAEYGNDIQDLSYFLFDLNGDGVTEIFIKGILPYDKYKWLYALDGDKPNRIGEYWSRRNCTGIYSGGYIYGFGSNGASDDVYFIEQMEPGATALTTAVSVEYHWDENGNLQSKLNGAEVTQAEAEAALKAYDDMRGEEIVPEWTPYQP